MLKQSRDEAKKITVQIEAVIFHNAASDWSVLRVTNLSDQRLVTAVGATGSVESGMILELMGSWTMHNSFGRQFRISEAWPCLPTTRAALIRYLSSEIFAGVGEKTATKIIDHLGDDSRTVLDEKPEQLRKIPGISKRIAKKIAGVWQEKASEHSTKLFLYQHGLTAAAASKIIKRYGNQSIAAVTSNPYRLIGQIKGLGFKRVDRLAHSLGIKDNHPQRVKAGIRYLLDKGEEQGHTFLFEQQLKNQLAEQLAITDASVVASAMEQLNTSAQIVRHQADLDEQAISLIECYEAERTIVTRLVELMKSRTPTLSDPSQRARIDSWIKRFCESTQMPLSSDQVAAVTECAMSKVFVMTGGPGVGKTTTARTIIHLFQAMGKEVALAAPTGRASQRLTELSGVQAKTIHRLLEWNAVNRCFTRNESNQLPAQVILVDEASMLDVYLASHLLLAIRNTSQLVIIGDHDQLPSVGAGSVLRDMLASKRIPHRRLTKVFRQASKSKIIQVAHAINTGVVSSFDDEIASDCHFIECQSEQEVLSRIARLLSTELKQVGYDPLTEVQILSPMNRGTLGCENLNTIVQDLLNPPSKKASATQKNQLRDGDKIIQTVNNYQLMVFNGDIGYVEHTQMEDGQLAVNFQDRLLTYDEESSRDIRLAYAITVHKAQGSEFPVVIIPMTMSHYMMLGNNLIYTALTRGKRLAIIIGSKAAYARAVHNETGRRRQTLLKSMLTESNTARCETE